MTYKNITGFELEYPKSGGIILHIDGHDSIEICTETAEELGVMLIKASTHQGSDE